MNNQENKEVSLYKLNQLVNLRLTASRRDIMDVLNEKKLQGVDISNYLSTLIRQAEGLPIPEGEGVPSLSAPKLVHAEASISEPQMDELVDKILRKLSSRGIKISNGSNESEVLEEEVKEDKATRQELEKIAVDLMSWDDDE
ncbi:hypothetical protein M5X06_00270 [Paenibacillus alvei]|uniref:Uncharacterized protein n=1 Tax=Paenibacillus alvei TaxID=44250 RepID=A0ABT4H465_PAEAL|nr:hypothetical protein [Paenibacillus alvei]MCY9763543.1 hypothetical protein [Paenibacillus alvei]MCY9765270.1 hypothetical protein [Paenibacillus alvei]